MAAALSLGQQHPDLEQTIGTYQTAQSILKIQLLIY